MPMHCRGPARSGDGRPLRALRRRKEGRVMPEILHNIHRPSDGFAGEQKPLPAKLPPVPKFNIELVPVSLRDWVRGNADGLQVPPEFVAVPAICSLGGLIGRQVGIRVKQSEKWIEFPILNAGLIGRPSTGKSPAFRPTLKILNELESRKRDAWLEEMKEHR